MTSICQQMRVPRKGKDRAQVGHWQLVLLVDSMDIQIQHKIFALFC
jgi:hypothetical protein